MFIYMTDRLQPSLITTVNTDICPSPYLYIYKAREPNTCIVLAKKKKKKNTCIVWRFSLPTVAVWGCTFCCLAHKFWVSQDAALLLTKTYLNSELNHSRLNLLLAPPIRRRRRHPKMWYGP